MQFKKTLKFNLKVLLLFIPLFGLSQVTWKIFTNPTDVSWWGFPLTFYKIGIMPCPPPGCNYTPDINILYLILDIIIIYLLSFFIIKIFLKLKDK